ncbi:uncharacterized protein MYCFIDRAFT_216387 [Pseudocercospora fijiensis CIRAD86]|uniref:DMAP1-binding domain-containing protein n=1 Tax=Pseudocercospora fijiensis (strain CIRAD86) TaxID=383855 RepID=M2ZJK9_PSEFD|nr:uncharacterized protein MYCFIDRAFT_216387 [Pseudocercospora fijiensis CIRAD86]EME79269.1 hypothetical protein MYCFIDRAFT_216387 [Pseudocercospora fijiensis CIRAD86]
MTDDGFVAIFFLFILNWITGALWQYIILYFLGALTNSPRKCANYAETTQRVRHPMAPKEAHDMADMPPNLRKQLDLLDLEFQDGEITQKGYDKRRSIIMAKYAKILKRKAPTLGAPLLFKATVVETADAAMTVRSSVADVEEGILATIKKCLEVSRHPDTPESEAKAALLLATRRMKQYNVSQAEVLEHATPEQQQNYVSESIVHLTHRDGDSSKGVHRAVWLYRMVHAIELFFDTKASYRSYRRNKTKLAIVFCGLANNSVAAAYAFEMVYNLAGEWSRKLTNANNKNGNERTCYANKRNSYIMALSEELQKMARRERKAEERRAARAEEETLAARIEEEEARRKAELDRLKGPFNHNNPHLVTIEDEGEGEGKVPFDEDTIMHRDSDSESNEEVDEVMRDPNQKQTPPISPQRVFLFQKMMKRVAASVFENDSANCIILVAAINDELESNPDLGTRFQVETEAVDILNCLVDLEVLESDGNTKAITLTRLGRQKIFGHTHENADETNALLPSANDSGIDFDDAGSDGYGPEDWDNDYSVFDDNEDVQSLASTAKADNLMSALFTPEPNAPAFSSKSQVVRFRQKTKQLIEDFIEKEKHKYTWGPAPRRREMDSIDEDAWSRGKKDAHKIDVHRKNIMA